MARKRNVDANRMLTKAKVLAFKKRLDKQEKEKKFSTVIDFGCVHCPKDNSYHHVSVCLDEESIRLYIDGELLINGKSNEKAQT